MKKLNAGLGLMWCWTNNFTTERAGHEIYACWAFIEILEKAWISIGYVDAYFEHTLVMQEGPRGHVG